MRRVKRRQILLTLVFAASITAVTNLSAVDTSVWVNSGQPYKELVGQSVAGSSSDKYCQYRNEYELQYHTLYGQRLSFYELVPVWGCWYNTGFGVIGSGSTGYLYIQASGDPGIVRYRGELSLLNHPLNDSNGIASATKSIKNGISFTDLYIIDDLQSRLHINKTGAYDQYSLLGGTTWSLNASENNVRSVGHVGSSKNGKWIIAEAGGVFVRVNVVTKEVLSFEKSMFGYGYGLDPYYELTVSDDGRYAIISGGNIYSRISNIYDLASCQAVVGQPFTVASGCGKRNFKTDVFPTMEADRSPFRYIFNDDATNISVDVPSASGVGSDRYIVTAPGVEPHYLDYLALGDSYTSGEGEYDGNKYYVPGTDGNGANLAIWRTGLDNFPYQREKCHLSTRSYPYLLARSAGVSNDQFHSVACSGSTMNDVINTSSEYFGRYEQLKNDTYSDKKVDIKLSAVQKFIPGRAAQIEFVKKYKPKVVTIGIGGNDIGFSNKITDCSVPVKTCDWTNELRFHAGKEAQINLYFGLDEMYKKLKNASPSTRFIAVGYPNIISDQDDICAPNVWLNTYERQFAREYVRYINQVVKAAATNNHIQYIDIEESLAGDRLCDASYDGKAVQGLVYGKDMSIPIIIPAPFGTISTYIGVDSESYHPTHIGHQMIANSIQSQMGSDNIMTYNTCPAQAPLVCYPVTTISPPLPAYFTSYNTPNIEASDQVTAIESAYMIDNKAAVQQGQNITVTQPRLKNGEMTKLAPNQTAPITMRSDPQQVGTIQTDAESVPSGSVTIPENTEPGYHTLIIEMKNSLYQNVALYQPIFVYDTIEDFDGDGTPNDKEVCGLVEPAGQDRDRDGVDDACDGIISEPPDTTPPTVTAKLVSQPNENGWYDKHVTIQWDVTDDKDTDIAPPADIVADKESEHTYTSAEVCDAAGNCASGSITLKVDTTPPIITAPTFSTNPKSVTEHSTMSAGVTEITSGLAEAEYFIADDPGLGNGATMTINDLTTLTEFGTDFVTGVYKISVRARDKAGNWSAPSSDYLAVYDVSSGVRFRGARTLNLTNGDNKLPWVTNPSIKPGKFAFSVRYGNDGTVTRQSDFQFAYKTGENCHKPAITKDCHSVELNASRISWLTTGGSNQSYGVFHGEGVLRLDNQTQNISFTVHGVDGERLSPVDNDEFSLTIYPPDAMLSSEPLYFIAPSDLKRGDIKIRF